MQLILCEGVVLPGLQNPIANIGENARFISKSTIPLRSLEFNGEKVPLLKCFGTNDLSVS